MPVASIPCEPGCIQTQHSANFSSAKPSHEPLKARPCYRSTGGTAKIIVDYFDVAKAETPGLADQIVLPSLTFEVHLHLCLGRLPDVDHGLAIEHHCRQKLSIDHRWPPDRRRRRPTSEGWPGNSALAPSAVDSSPSVELK